MRPRYPQPTNYRKQTMKSKFEGFIGFILSIIIGGLTLTALDASATVPPPWVNIR